MVKKTIDIEYLIIWRNLNGIATANEQGELHEWLQKDARHQQLYEHLKVSNEQEYVLSDTQIENQWRRLQNRIDEKPALHIRKWLQYAAAILLPLMIGAGVIYLSNKEEQRIETAHQVEPGSSKAKLKLGNGEYLELDVNSNAIIKDEKGQILGVDSLDILRYKSNEQSTTEYNTISIPRGGEYQLVLADGTKVWLNSETTLTYPVNFTGNTREVMLTGEAFFDVSTNAHVPFIVKTKDAAVKVYGTQFNVMAYQDDKMHETTLVEGSVAVLYNNKEVMIEPGQQAQINAAGGGFTVREVDTQLYTDWKNGIFRFEEMTLKDVASKLSRWYNVDFYFANEEVKTRTISGAMKRSTEFDLFMGLIEKSVEAEVSMEGNNVLIKGKY